MFSLLNSYSSNAQSRGIEVAFSRLNRMELVAFILSLLLKFLLVRSVCISENFMDNQIAVTLIAQHIFTHCDCKIYNISDIWITCMITLTSRYIVMLPVFSVSMCSACSPRKCPNLRTVRFMLEYITVKDEWCLDIVPWSYNICLY